MPKVLPVSSDAAGRVIDCGRNWSSVSQRAELETQSLTEKNFEKRKKKSSFDLEDMNSKVFRTFSAGSPKLSYVAS